jgi:hypothetical protein
MLYQLSYALKPHYQVSTFGRLYSPFNKRQRKLLLLIASVAERLSHRLASVSQTSHKIFRLGTGDLDIGAGFIAALRHMFHFGMHGRIRRFGDNFTHQSRIIIGLSHLSRTTVSLT